MSEKKTIPNEVKDLNQKVLDEIKIVEQEALKIKDDAVRKNAEAIQQAKDKALSVLSQQEKELEAAKDENIRRRKKQIDAECAKISSEGQKNMADDEKKTRKNIKKTAEFIADDVLSHYGG